MAFSYSNVSERRWAGDRGSGGILLSLTKPLSPLFLLPRAGWTGSVSGSAPFSFYSFSPELLLLGGMASFSSVAGFRHFLSFLNS